MFLSSPFFLYLFLQVKAQNPHTFRKPCSAKCAKNATLLAESHSLKWLFLLIIVGKQKIWIWCTRRLQSPFCLLSLYAALGDLFMDLSLIIVSFLSWFRQRIDFTVFTLIGTNDHHSTCMLYVSSPMSAPLRARPSGHGLMSVILLLMVRLWMQPTKPRFAPVALTSQ